MNHVLLVDDDIELCEMLEEYLSDEGFSLSLCHDGQSALDKLSDTQEANTINLVILDIMLPKVNGLDCLKLIREKSRVPIIMLTAKGEDIDRILGLELGADDYMPKPFNPRELVARIRAHLRRWQDYGSEQAQIVGKSPILNNGKLCVQPGNRTASYADERIDLTSMEYNLLEVLILNVGKVVEKQQLSQQALGRELADYDRSIDMHISKLRKKLEQVSPGSDLIKTIRGIGYQLIEI